MAGTYWYVKISQIFNYKTNKKNTCTINLFFFKFKKRKQHSPYRFQDRCKGSWRCQVVGEYRTGWTRGRARFRECWRWGCRRWIFSNCRKSNGPPPRRLQSMRNYRPIGSCRPPVSIHPNRQCPLRHQCRLFSMRANRSHHHLKKKNRNRKNLVLSLISITSTSSLKLWGQIKFLSI